MRMASTEPNQRTPGQEKQCDGFASRRSDPDATPGDTNMSRDVLRLWLRLCKGWVDESRLASDPFARLLFPISRLVALHSTNTSTVPTTPFGCTPRLRAEKEHSSCRRRQPASILERIKQDPSTRDESTKSDRSGTAI